MSDTAAKSGEVIAPGEPDLATLARQINAEHDAVRTALVSGAQRAIAAGKLLLKAKALVSHGHWEDWVAANTKLSDRVAQRYMVLASGDHLLMTKLMTKAPNLADLTMSGAIKLLEELKNPEAKLTNLRGQRGGKRDAVTEALKKNPLAILTRAWEAAEQNERDIFLSKIRKDMQ